MNTITVRYTYCQEHCENHMVDERGTCHGESTYQMRAHGYRYIRHIGGGWYQYRAPAEPIPLPLDWEMLLDARTDAQAMSEPDF